LKVWVALGISQGHVVALREGTLATAEVLAPDPVKEAVRWAEQGADGLHIVDLDAVFGLGRNSRIISEIVSRVRPVAIQVGGGLRTDSDVVELLSIGVTRVVMGSILVREPDRFHDLAKRFPGRVAAGLDTSERIVRISGWTEGTAVGIEDAVLRAHALGAAAAVVTDISRYGRGGGPNVDLFRELVEHLPGGFELVVSGGIGSADDLVVLKVIGGVDGVILGRTLYEGKIELKEAVDRLHGRGAPFR